MKLSYQSNYPNLEEKILMHNKNEKLTKAQLEKENSKLKKKVSRLSTALEQTKQMMRDLTDQNISLAQSQGNLQNQLKDANKQTDELISKQASSERQYASLYGTTNQLLEQYQEVVKISEDRKKIIEQLEKELKYGKKIAELEGKLSAYKEEIAVSEPPTPPIK